MTRPYDVVALGAVCVDIQINAQDKTLQEHGLQKGLSNVISAGLLTKILNSAAQRYQSNGGPGSNVAAGVAARGGKSALIGKVANDEHGKFFVERALDLGIDFTPRTTSDEGMPTTAIAVMTTPDRERTFGFINGASYQLSPADVDNSLISRAKVLYLDSYLWLSESGKATVHHAASAAKVAGTKVAISLNDARVVENNAAAFRALIKEHAHILVGDRNEFAKMLGTDSLVDTLTELTKMNVIAAVTAGKEGAHVVHDNQAVHVPAQKIDQAKVVDTNGAGDQFAAGFIYGLARGVSPVTAAMTGAAWAAEIIQHRGGEPIVSWRKPKRGVGTDL